MAIKFLNTVQVDTDVLYVDTANSNVGIGTSSPSTYFTLDVNGSANFSSDIQVGRNATALSFDMNPGYDSGSYYLKLYKNQTNDGGVLLYSKPTSGIAQLDWQIVNQGTTGDLKFYAYGLAGNALILDRETGSLQLPEYGAGTLVSDASGNITVSSGGGAGGPYLPLSAGASYPLTGDLYYNGEIRSTTPAGKLILTNNSTTTELHAAGTGGIQFKGDGNDVEMVIIDGGNVGIGTTNPSRLLSISSNDTATTPQLLVTQNGAGDAVIGFNRPGYQGWAMGIDSSIGNNFEIHNSSGGVDSSSQLAITPSGNVGIGTTSPLDLLALHNNTAGAVDAQMNFTTAATGQTISDGFRVGWNGSVAQMYLFENADMRFATNNTERMRITSAGKVGIKTTNPQDALDIDWDEEGVATDNSGIRVRAYRPHLNLIDRSGYTTTNGHNFQIKADSAKLQFNATSADDETFDLTRMVIDKDGKVGIGTDSPGTKLYVKGGTSDDVIARFKAVGTGTSDYSQIDVANNVDQILRIGSVGSNYANSALAGMRYIIATHGGLALKAQASDGNVRIYTGSTINERMRVDSSGNVGIGTTDPKSKLEVDGGVKIGDDTDTASADKVGTLKYRVSGNNSYVDMCMQTGATTYAWINIVQNNW